MQTPTFLRLNLYRSISVLMLLLVCFSVSGQGKDTLPPDTINVSEMDLPKHSPTKASLFSAVLPGLGQAYNRKYWKMPLVYAGIGIPLYFGLEQNQFYQEKYDAYRQRLSGDSSDVFLQTGNFFTNEALLKSMDINRRNRDLMYIITGAIYLLQIVDATVDAHLFYFNVSDDLSLRYQPYIYYARRENAAIKGLTLTLNF